MSQREARKAVGEVEDKEEQEQETRTVPNSANSDA